MITGLIHDTCEMKLLFLGISVSEIIAFHTSLTSYSTIPDEAVLLFNEVLLNEGDGWVSCFMYLSCLLFFYLIRVMGE